MRRWSAAACLVAGVAVLASPGWALLAAAAVLYLTPVPDTVRARARTAAKTAGDAGLRVWLWLTGSKRATAIAASCAGIVLVPLGVGVVAAAGFGVIAAGVLLLGAGLMLGWNTG